MVMVSNSNVSRRGEWPLCVLRSRSSILNPFRGGKDVTGTGLFFHGIVTAFRREFQTRLENDSTRASWAPEYGAELRR